MKSQPIDPEAEFLKDMRAYSGDALAGIFQKRHGQMPPDSSPAHEAMETPAEEALEHATGMEAQDEPRR